MELMGSKGELSAGYKLVPWSCWDQWKFVKESIFSSSPDAVGTALQKISAWRSRGCLPVPIDVTAAFIEIQQKDPFFRRDPINSSSESDEMLSMLYSMTIIRLVNCFVAHKKTKYSISELADAAGIPRVLVDIRHESSHRDLPSLRLVRLASLKALDWLKHNYWEPQNDAIPDVRKEIRSRLLEMTYLLKTKNSHKSSSNTKQRRLMGTTVLRVGNKLSSQITAKLQSSKNVSMKQISKIVRIIARLYSSYPSEVVSVLLELFQLEIPGFSESIDLEHSDDSSVGVSGSTSSMDELKSIITKLSSKRPRLLLSMLKNVLEMIEVSFVKIQKGEYDIYSSQDHANIHCMSNLCSLSPWLIMNIKMLKDSGLIRLIDEAEVLPIHKNTLPKVSLSMLLRKCLTLSVHDKHLLDSVWLLVEMLGDTSVKERLKKLPLLSLKSSDSMEGPTYPDTGSMLLQEEDVVKNATDNLEIMKLNLKSRRKRINGNNSDTTSIWTVAKSWTSCPIGMLPCSFSSTAVLPVLDKFDNELETDVGTNKDAVLNCSAASDGLLDCHTEPSEVGNAFKKLKPSLDDVQCVDCSETTCPMEGRLLIYGMWIKVSEEELQAIESNIRTFC
ncbi:hypothetical protein C4D60_Mb11t17770 [Musa balbisiana]|uniref:Las1-like family protein n=1 Tax=Musa balbisiana TaxID=52838 RepID=A0A4S8J4V2_MUSBA|nr:hypothetical protein C4D60_Mb11t17770 [Musa balbisiana]